MSYEKNIRQVTPYIPGEQPKGGKVIKLNTNECPYPPAPSVREAMDQLEIGMLRLYPDTEAGDLGEALCSYHQIKKEQLFVGVGSDDVLAMAFLTFFNGKLPILFPDITYSFYDVWAGLYHIPFEKKLLDENFCLKKEDYLIENGGIIIPNPNAPTGILEPLSFFEEVAAANRDSVVIVDEAYIDFGGESCRPLIDQYDNVLVVQTFSKSRAMAGMRIGFAMGNERLIRHLKAVKFAFNSYTMNLPSIELGAACVGEETYFRETVRKICNTRERVKIELMELGFTFPDSKGNFLFVTHKTMCAKDIFDALRESDIYVRYFDSPRINNYLRITIGTDEEMDILLGFLKGYLFSKEV